MTSATVLLVLCMVAGIAQCGEPVFDPGTMMQLVLVPADAAVGSIIYRVRASDPDFDYPLQFELIGQMGRLDISIETLPCTRYNSVCQANVILLRRIEPGRYIDFRLSVRNTRGRSSRIACSITGTNATTPRDTIFPHQPGIILVPEDAKRGTDLEIVIARKNQLSPKPLELELWGSPLFAIRQRRVSTENTEGTIFLVGSLDFEAQSMYHLSLLAVDPFVEIGKDTRNIAGIEVVVVVQDIQDMPPVFTFAPPITHLPKQVTPGDVVVKVRAEDGDKGAPRQIRYGLVSEGNPFTPFFNINETSGEVSLERPVEEIAAISHAGAPILLTVVAEEVRLSLSEPEAMSSTVQLAFILPERENSPPYFENQFYITYLDENAQQGTALVFNDPYIPQVNDNDAGQNGAFSLSLLGNNGTFEVSPTVAERHTQFIIKVRDNTMLDYEARKSVHLQIVAKELGPSSNLSAISNITVYLNDVNDNPPIFLEQQYEVELPENITAGARVVQVTADDVDTGMYGKIQYTAILGYLNTSLHLDPISGMITIATNNHGFDREAMPDLHFLVEARDNDGLGLRVTVPLIIKLLDVNDNPPEFEKSLYEFVLSPSLNNFTSPAIVKAIDKDAEPPNNVVRYEIIEGNSGGKYHVNDETGELYLLETLKRTKKQNVPRPKRQFTTEEESEVYVLAIRAYDLGVPRLFSSTMVKIYPPESKVKTMSFIVPGSNPDRKKLEDVLSTLSGGKVSILEIKPYKTNDQNQGVNDSSQEKSEVVAIVRLSGNTAINVAKLQEQLAKNKTIYMSNSGNSDQDSIFNSDSSLYRTESKILFWLLILLAIIVALVLLLLICCCICEGCPLYMPPRKRVIRVNSTEDDVHLVVRDKAIGKDNKSNQNVENKSIQATDWRRREAWSAEQTDLRTKPTQWKFNKKNYVGKDPNKPASTPGDLRQEFVTAAANDYNDTRQSFIKRDGPNIIYTKEMQLQEAYNKKHNEYMEDLENGYDRIATLHNRKDNDNDSMRRAEDIGSDVFIKSDDNVVKKNIKENKAAPTSLGRDQYFIKEGNTEILRLVTRGKNEEERYVNLPIHQQRPVTLVPHTQYVVVDSGKNLLMERFIREQGEEVQNIEEQLSKLHDLDNVITDKELKSVGQRSHAGSDAAHQYDMHTEVPGSIPLKSEFIQSALLEIRSKSNMNQELLESSLRKQNELLHQILLERERMLQNHETASQVESKLETQSLPGQSAAGTQTECHIGTQTEPQLISTSRRKARSDNDSFSEDESQTVVEDESRKGAWMKRKKSKKKIKYKDPRRSIRVCEIKRKIKTPIIEEGEVSPNLECEKHTRVSKVNQREELVKKYGDITKSTITTCKNETVSSTQIEIIDDKKSGIRKDVLMEISDSLDERNLQISSPRKSKLQRQTPILREVSTVTKEVFAPTEHLENCRSDSSLKEQQTVFSSPRQDSSNGTTEINDDTDNNEIKSKISSKNNDNNKVSDKSYQKSLPRYMQWYNKKDSAKPATSEKLTPNKPTRNSKPKPNDDIHSHEKINRYGKIGSKERSEIGEVKKSLKTKDNDFVSARFLKEAKVSPVPEVPLPDVHPLLQHSEHRYEHKYEDQNPLCYIQPTHIPKYLGSQPNIPLPRKSVQQPMYVNQNEAKKNKKDVAECALTHSIAISANYEPESKPNEVHVSKISIGGDNAADVSRKSKLDDNDSGIAINSLVQQKCIKRLPITEKKSVFTIAYDDVHTKQLRPDSSSTS